MFDDSIHQDVILVKDPVLAATLFTREHRALITYQDTKYNYFFAFAITHRLRKDIRLYYGGKLSVDARELNNELNEIYMYLGDYECWVQAKQSDQYAMHK